MHGMQSSDLAGVPDGWVGPQRRIRDLVAITVVLAIAAASVVFAILAGIAGDFAALRYSLLFGLIMALTAALGAVMRGRSADLSKAAHTVDLGDEQGTELRYSRAQFGLMIALMTCCAILLIAAAAEIFADRGATGIPGATMLLATIAVIFLSFITVAALGHISRGGLVLSSRGISQRGWSFESRLNWADIAGAKTGYNGYPVIMLIGYANADWERRYTTRLWRIDRLPPAPMIEVDCRKFDVDPAALLSFLTAYVDTPDNRAELGTPAALRRAQDLTAG